MLAACWRHRNRGGICKAPVSEVVGGGLFWGLSYGHRLLALQRQRLERAVPVGKAARLEEAGAQRKAGWVSPQDCSCAVHARESVGKLSPFAEGAGESWGLYPALEPSRGRRSVSASALWSLGKRV